MDQHPIFTMSLALFLLMDSIGNVPLYISFLKQLPTKRQTTIILRELLIALVVIYAFYFGGNYFLRVLSISQETIQISGGIILFLISLKMIFPVKKEATETFDKEPFIVPLAIPLVAGPAVLALVMIYSHQGFSMIEVVSSIAIAWVASTAILILSPLFNKVLGPKGLTALERLMGLVLTLLAIEMLLDGISAFVMHPHIK